MRIRHRKGHPVENLVLPALRLLLAFWLLFGPLVLGYWGTFAQRQNTVMALIAIPTLALGFAIKGMRVALLGMAMWLLASPWWSGWYDLWPQAIANDVITGAVALLLGIFPLWRVEEAEVVEAEA